MKYTVKIQMTEKTFDTYAAAMEYFRKTWIPGLVWSVVKTDACGIVFAD